MKMNLSTIMKSTRLFVERRTPELLTGFGITGLITAGVIGILATPEALRRVEEKEDEIGNRLLTKKEVIQVTWKCYVPAVVTAVVSTSCIIGASSVNFRRNTALATAYSLSETALKEYQEKVVQTMGREKHEEIRTEITNDRIRRNPAENNEVVIIDNGNTLCYDPTLDRYFRSDVNKLRRIENELNRRMRDEMYISLNDLYYELGLKSISGGDDLGWNIDNGYIDMCFRAQLDPNDNPCLVIDYRVSPKHNYYKS